MYKYLIGIGVVVVAIIAIVLNTTHPASAPGGVQACTTEAKICPDGSAVGRTGPNCEFAECPAVATTTPVSTTSVLLKADMNQKVTGVGVSLTPLKILEDSRCPSDVQCIQAGTVRVQVRLTSASGTATQEFKLGQAVTTETQIITLTEVLPAKKSTVTLKASDYVFTFEIKKRTSTSTGSGSISTQACTMEAKICPDGSAVGRTGPNCAFAACPNTSGVTGKVLLGPTCPVERNPPDPNCADTPYGTKITVRRAGSSSVFATGASDASGTYQIALPAGTYMISALGGAVYPRCADATVTVPANAYATANISCDTGIR